MKSITGPLLRAGTSLCVLAVALGAAGCGDDDGQGSGATTEAVGQRLGGSVAQLVQCRDWAPATPGEKLATIEDIRSQVNREDAGVSASELSDDEAMRVFDHGCAKPYAAGFRLHVLYARAAAFKPLRDIAEGEGEADSG